MATPTNARIPNVDRTDPLLREAVRVVAAAADKRCGDARENFWERSKAARNVFADVMWLDEQERLEGAVTTAPEIVIEGERYRRLKQQSSVVVHGLWGAHRVVEPLYRLVGLHNGPTIKPLVAKLGLVDGSLLPDLADEAGELLSKMTSRDVEATLTRQGFRPPSRTTLANRLSRAEHVAAYRSRAFRTERPISHRSGRRCASVSPSRASCSRFRTSIMRSDISMRSSPHGTTATQPTWPAGTA